VARHHFEAVRGHLAHEGLLVDAVSAALGNAFEMPQSRFASFWA